MRGFCAGCGQKKRLRWPIGQAIFCSKDCAATMAWSDASAGGGHCSECGSLGCQRDHELDEGEVDEEGFLTRPRPTPTI